MAASGVDYPSDAMIPCGACDEEGQVECEQCGGTGQDDEGRECMWCDGERYFDCEDCDGEGRVPEGFYDS